MHAGWPMLDVLLAVLYTHPQVYVDIGVICYVLPQKAFYSYLQKKVEAGFGSGSCLDRTSDLAPGH